MSLFDAAWVHLPTDIKVIKDSYLCNTSWKNCNFLLEAFPLTGQVTEDTKVASVCSSTYFNPEKIYKPAKVIHVVFPAEMGEAVNFQCKPIYHF